MPHSGLAAAALVFHQVNGNGQREAWVSKRGCAGSKNREVDPDSAWGRSMLFWLAHMLSAVPLQMGNRAAAYVSGVAVKPGCPADHV